MSFTSRLFSRTGSGLRRIGRWLTASKHWDSLLNPTPPPRRTARPTLEALEDRTLLSVTAIADSYSTPYAQELSVQSTGVLTNDTGSNLTASIVTPPTHGTATINADGGFTYTQTDFDFLGQDTFTYQATDGTDSDTATVIVDIQPAAVIEASQDDILVGDTVTFSAYPHDYDTSTIADIAWDFDYDGITFEPDPGTYDQLTVDRTFDDATTTTFAVVAVHSAPQLLPLAG